jgi:hypothetical protein
LHDQPDAEALRVAARHQPDHEPELALVDASAELDGLLRGAVFEVLHVDAAAAANADAQAALAAYEKALATARADARKLAEGVRAEAATERAKATAEADAKLAQRLAAAEQRLAAQRVEGLKAADEAAADVAQAIYAKLAGSAA